MDKTKCHFSGYATRNDLLCGDGRTIRKNAFKHCDGETVPLIWNHDHVNPDAVLGHALLENRDDGVYAYCEFNETEQGIHARQLVEHGDIRSLSIYANKLKQIGNDVIHGVIRELSLVHAGSNPGAFIDFILAHGEDEEDGLIANYDENALVIYHSDIETEKTEPETEVEQETKQEPEQELEHSEEAKEEKKEDKPAEKSEDDETVGEVFDTLTDKQKNAVYYMLGKAVENNTKEESEGGNETMKHNVFDQSTQSNEEVLTHTAMQEIFADAKRLGSLRESVLSHADVADKIQTYGINGTDWLFPEDKVLNNPPEFIKRDTGWVTDVMNGVHHSPFSRIKSVFADITEDEARAKGYIKGKLKKEEVFGLLKRSTSPTTIYKKQKMDRDDIIDITDMDVVAWIKREMRLMLDEEIARAILFGDGRLNSSDDKISELNIRPVWTDEDLFTIKTLVDVAADADADAKAKALIRAIVKSRKLYKGSGNLTMFTTEDYLTDLLLMEDSTGRIIYDSVEKLKAMLRVSKIVTVPVMEGLTRKDGEGNTLALGALLVNLKDYNVGADKGGAINMFDDFDIDYNQFKYLIETRCSGALTKPFSAIAVEFKTEVAGA